MLIPNALCFWCFLEDLLLFTDFVDAVDHIGFVTCKCDCGLLWLDVAWRWCAQSGVLCILSAASAALALPAWLPWLGATSQVRGQFGVTIGSNVLPNKAAGPRDQVRPVSWQQALPPTPNHGSSRPGGDWDRRAPFSFHQLQFICSYKLARTN